MGSISVIIPTRGRHHFLREAIASVLAQSELPHEIIVVDDGTGAREAVASLHPLIRILDNEQRGPVPARNLGVAAATGQIICFLDDDDWFTDASYLTEANRLIEAGAVFCYANGRLVFEDGRPDLPFEFPADASTLTRDNTILISGVVYRRSLHDGLGFFDEALPYYWDWDWYLRVARAGHALTHIERSSVAIRVHARNMSGESLEADRRRNLALFSTKHGLPALPLKNHLDIARGTPGSPPETDDPS